MTSNFVIFKPSKDNDMHGHVSKIKELWISKICVECLLCYNQPYWE